VRVRDDRQRRRVVLQDDHAPAGQAARERGVVAGARLVWCVLRVCGSVRVRLCRTDTAGVQAQGGSAAAAACGSAHQPRSQWPQGARAAHPSTHTWKPLSSTHTGNGPGGASLPGDAVIGTVAKSGSRTGRSPRAWWGAGRVDVTWSWMML
jgi:hypothetical protein